MRSSARTGERGADRVVADMREDSGEQRDLAREAMLHAAQRRLRPIVMTAIAAVCGMLPLAFALGAGSQMLQPLAIAVIGGLLISVFLSLIVTPAVYYRLTRKRHVRGRGLESFLGAEVADDFGDVLVLAVDGVVHGLHVVGA